MREGPSPEREARSTVDAGISGSRAAFVAQQPPPDALPGIEVGIRRRDPTGAIEGALNPEESVDLATLIEAYTVNGAWIMHQEDEVGSIEVGKTADLVVLEKNLFEIPPQEIGEVRVLETFVNGESVFRAR